MLADAGQPVVAVVSRDIQHAGDAAVFVGGEAQAFRYTEFPRTVRRWLIAVPDRALSEVASMLSASSSEGVALHTCGARGADVLGAMQGRGVACGTLHPFQTIISGMAGVAALRGIAFGVSGDPEAVEWAGQIAGLAQGVVLRIGDEARQLYHAAAVMSSNYVCALLDASQTLLEQCGVDSGTALRALTPLMRSAVENGLARGPLEALTGPIERGDVETVAGHLAALDAVPAAIRNLYRAAGLQTVQLARRRQLDAERARELELLLSRD